MSRTRVVFLTFFTLIALILNVPSGTPLPVQALTEGTPETLPSHSPLSIYFFWSEGCPHCAKEEIFLETLADEDPALRIVSFEVSKNASNQELLQKTGKALNADTSFVPFTVIGDKYVVGYANDETTGKSIRDILISYETAPYRDVVAALIEGKDPGTAMHSQQATPTHISVPFIGDVDPSTLSLPMLTIVIAALDGFNPCAMWVLIFLISLLFGVENRFRRWALGIAFLFASGITYFLFLSAWLHSFLFLGAKTYVTAAIGIIALISGAYNLKEYRENKAGVCKVTKDDGRKRVFEKLKDSIHQSNFLLALGGIMILGFLVNLVELFCSAGFPAIFTNILSMTPMPTWNYYSYLVLYILIFMLDDMIVFFIAMRTLELTGISGKYSSLSHLIGGILMLVLGIVLIAKPSLLMFG